MREMWNFFNIIRSKCSISCFHCKDTYSVRMDKSFSAIKMIDFSHKYIKCAILIGFFCEKCYLDVIISHNVGFVCKMQ